MMQVACSTSVLARFDSEAQSPEQALESVRNAGFARIALDASSPPIATMSNGEVFERVTRWCSAATRLDVECSQIVSSEIDLSHGQATQRGVRWIEFAATLKVSSVVFPLVGALVDRVEPSTLQRLTAWGDCATASGVTLSLGTARSVPPDTRAMAQLMNAVRASALRLDFDTGLYQQWHPHRSGEIALQRIAGSLGSLRLREATGTPGEFESPPLGTGGAVDFARTCEIVKALKFRGPIVIEIDPPTGRRTSPSIETALGDSLQHLRDCGWYG